VFVGLRLFLSLLTCELLGLFPSASFFQSHGWFFRTFLFTISSGVTATGRQQRVLLAIEKVYNQAVG
jgi:hypothetical protein